MTTTSESPTVQVDDVVNQPHGETFSGAETKIPPKTAAQLLVLGFFSNGDTFTAPAPLVPAPEGQPPVPPTIDAQQSPTNQYDAPPPQAPELNPEVFDSARLNDQLGGILTDLSQYSDADIEGAVMYCMSQFRDLGLGADQLQTQHPELYSKFMQLHNLCRTRSKDFSEVPPTEMEVAADSARNRETVIEVYSRLALSEQGVPPSPNALAETQELLGLPSGAIDVLPENITEIQQLSDGTNPSLLLSFLDRAGQTVKTALEYKKTIATLVAIDALLFNGTYVHALGSLTDSTTHILRFCGMELKMSEQQKETYLNAMVDKLTTYQLFEFMDKRQPHELFAFLTDLGEESRQKMFAEKPFGGIFSSAHTFSKEQVTKLRSHLTTDQQKDLRIQSVAQTQ